MNTETIEHTPEPLETDEPTNGSLIHLARCAECGVSVRFSPTASGFGYVLKDATDSAFGLGDHYRPTCPNGHGEMELADDRLPIVQAMEQAAEKLAEPQRLPYPSPPFNYEGALHEIFEMEQANAVLESKFNDADERRKKAKTALDDGRSKLSALIATLKEREEDRLHEIARREAAAAAGHPDETNLVRCAWEQAHPDETCPMCSEGMNGATARDSAMHVDEVERAIFVAETAEIVELVVDAGIRLSADTVNAWSVEDREAVKTWAEIQNGLADAPEGGNVRPAILGTAHVAAGSTTSEAVPGETFQSCSECGARLLTYKTGDDEGASFEPYPAGTLVGTDCEGAKEPARRIAGRKRKAKA
jgi:hypothetical protein